jgi:glycosyltransferase involved in cell wall biosynthesis
VVKAINSVLSQTYREFELIVVNDGSTDDSLNVVQTFFKSPLGDLGVFSPPLGGWGVLTQSNLGVSIARNNGVKVAKYDYIAFLDADDWWEPTYLEEMKSLIEEFPQAGIYGSGYFLIKNGVKRVAPVGVEEDFKKGEINYWRTYSNTLCMPLTSISTIILKQIFLSEKGFNPVLKLGEDFDLWIRVVMKYPVVFLNKPLSNYNQDVDLQHRAIGGKLYEPHEHMLFTDYSVFQSNTEFRYLYERLALYGLLPYYLSGKNLNEVTSILNSINWRNHAFKYRLYYVVFPKLVLKAWMISLSLSSKIKQKLIRFLQPFFTKIV